MTTLIYIVTLLAVIAGLFIAIWSFTDTRRKYYEDYMNRKKND